ncbi:U-reduvitoxin-Pr21-like [Wyeomyia smithii]|uniref:U-reduvitoxin-Pr21-like n=1 Tax=Wyeomyia smithii TaxID=174621 RepID=UPI002467C592|nr:U-reduvitoxin-Pr21-like [Wyeomyia smithii]
MLRSLLLFATIITVGVFALQDGQKCEPGTDFMVDCNMCRCSADGKIMSCTRKFCVEEGQGDDPKAQLAATTNSDVGEKEEEHLQTNGQVCTPNEVKMEDCNRCKCAANGIGWFCTRKACKPRDKRDVIQETFARLKRAVEKKCVPGTSFKSADGCNDCFCTETGIAACTLRFCFSNVEQGVSPNKFKRSSDDDIPRSLIQPGASGFSCAPYSNFKYQCNMCHCDGTGKLAGCTYKLCLPDEY